MKQHLLTATITLSVFDELTVVDNPSAVQEGLVAVNFALQPQDGYTIDPTASEIDLTIADNPDSQILISPSASTEVLIESQDSVGVFTLSLSAPPPAEGITVSVSTTSLDYFDTNEIEVVGGTIAAVRDNGLDVTITERQANINLPVASDDLVEGSETITFTVEPGDTYEVNQEATGDSLPAQT